MTKTDAETVEALSLMDEQYDTMMEVERNPTGAFMAIENMAATLRALAAERDKLRAENERLRGEGRDHIGAAQHFADGQADAESDRDTWVYACNLAIQERMSSEAKAELLRDALAASVEYMQFRASTSGEPFPLARARAALEATK